MPLSVLLSALPIFAAAAIVAAGIMALTIRLTAAGHGARSRTTPAHPPTREAVQKMLEILTSPEFDLFTTVRHEMGQDIAGACGQLALKTPDAPDMEDMIAPKKKTRAVAKKFKASSSSTKPPEGATISSSVVPSRGWSRIECALVAATALSAVVLAVAISNRKARA